MKAVARGFRLISFNFCHSVCIFRWTS